MEPLYRFLLHTKYNLLLLASALITGCATPNDIQTVYDPAVNFRTYQTYNWHPAEVPAPNQGSSGSPYSTLLDQQIKEAIASELLKNGLRPDTNSPSLLVAYDVAIEAPQEAVKASDLAPGFGYGYSYWFGYRYRYSGTGLQNFRRVGEYLPGSLIIDLIDQNTNQVVWRGAYDAGINPAAVDASSIARAVANVMSQFPPVPSTAR